MWAIVLNLIKLPIPAGVVDHGTDLDSKGFWQDVNYVRWTNGKPHPIGGWDTVGQNPSAELLSNNTFTGGTPAPQVGWTADSNWGADGANGYTIDGYGGTLGARLHTTASLTDGNNYLITVTGAALNNSSESGIRLVVNGQTSPIITLGSGSFTHTARITSLTSADTEIGVEFAEACAESTFVGDPIYIHSISLVEVQVTNIVDSSTEGVTRGAHAWRSNAGAPWFASGTYNALKVMDGNYVVYDITPTSLTPGLDVARKNTGYGGGAYGASTYGTQRNPIDASAATNWSLDNWGENLLACSDADGSIWEWDLDTTSNASIVSNAPTSNKSIFVTAERFVFALSPDGNPRQIKWCDREDNTTWAPAVTNEAGDIELATSGELVTGLKVRGRSLILTTSDAWIATYQGPPLVYGFQKIGSACGCAGRNLAANVGAFAFWMGDDDFYMYNGSNVTALECTVHDSVFQEFNKSRISHAFCVPNQNNNEVWWFFPGNSEEENTRYVYFDYRDNHWGSGSMARSAGADTPVFDNPIYVGDDGTVYRHEVGFHHDTPPYLETGPINFDDGNNTFTVLEAIVNCEGSNDAESLTFYTRYQDVSNALTGDDWTAVSPSYNTGSNPISTRFSGRQIKYRFTAPDGIDWRWGDLRLRVKQRGRR